MIFCVKIGYSVTVQKYLPAGDLLDSFKEANLFMDKSKSFKFSMILIFAFSLHCNRVLKREKSAR